MTAAERRHLWAGLVSGLGAGIALVFFTIVLRFALDAPTLQEVLADKLLALTPATLFEFLLDRLGRYGKPFLFLGLTLALVVSGALLGGGYVWLVSRRSPLGFHLSPWQSLILTAGLWAFFSLIVAPVSGVGPFGREAIGGGTNFSLATLAASVAYGMTLHRLYGYLVQRLVEADVTQRPPRPGETRRVFLRRMLLWSAGVGVVAFGLRTISSGVSRMGFSFGNPLPPGQMPPFVTPNDRFYVVSKNFVDPELHVEERPGQSNVWELRMEGLVESPYTISYTKLLAMPAVEEFVTLECISNPVGGELISNAYWKGVSVRDLLDRAGGIRPATQKIVFHAADNYSSGIALPGALGPQVILAYQMNGEPLPPAHGFPVRLLVPGRYGMKSVKWVTRIEAVDYDYQGYWEDRGWSDEAVVKTTSIILVPSGGATFVDGPLPLGGVAFSGDRGIGWVEVSVDKGQTWQLMGLEPSFSPYSWVLWIGQHKLPAGWQGMLQVRARDTTGILQTAQQQGAAPDGASGHHRLPVVIRPRESVGDSD